MEKEKMFKVVIPVTWTIPASTSREAIDKAKTAVSERGFAFLPSGCFARRDRK